MWLGLLLLVVMSFLFFRKEKSVSGHYDAKWRPIKCPKCRSTNIRSDPDNWEYWKCNECGKIW